MRREFKMTDAERAAILDASRAVPAMMIGGTLPPSPQENANRAWARLGAQLGFDPMSVRPVDGKTNDYFTAEVADMSREALLGRVVDILRRSNTDDAESLISQLEKAVTPAVAPK